MTNSHRREALALLELLYTDASCYDLFAKGDGKEEQFHPWQNLYLNASGLLPETDEQPQWSLRPMGSASTTVQLPQSWMPAGH